MHKLFPLQALSHSNHSPLDKDTDCLGVKQQAGRGRRSSLWGWPCSPSSLDTREVGKEHRSRVPTQRLSLWRESLEGHSGPRHWTREWCGCDCGSRALICGWGITHTEMGNRDLHSDLCGAGGALFFFGYRFLQRRWSCFCSFFPALGNTSKFVVLFPKLSQFLTLLLQFIF